MYYVTAKRRLADRFLEAADSPSQVRSLISFFYQYNIYVRQNYETVHIQNIIFDILFMILIVLCMFVHVYFIFASSCKLLQ
jgi:hypothetical protein